MCGQVWTTSARLRGQGTKPSSLLQPGNEMRRPRETVLSHQGGLGERIKIPLEWYTHIKRGTERF